MKIFQARDRGLRCECWDCLRAVGVTPPRALTDHHRDLRGNIYNSHNGEIDRSRTKSLSEARSEAEVVMSKGRGQDV